MSCCVGFQWIKTGSPDYPLASSKKNIRDYARSRYKKINFK
jgi:hypothetical protein